MRTKSAIGFPVPLFFLHRCILPWRASCLAEGRTNEGAKLRNFSLYVNLSFISRWKLEGWALVTELVGLLARWWLEGLGQACVFQTGTPAALLFAPAPSGYALSFPYAHSTGCVSPLPRARSTCLVNPCGPSNSYVTGTERKNLNSPLFKFRIRFLLWIKFPSLVNFLPSLTLLYLIWPLYLLLFGLKKTFLLSTPPPHPHFLFRSYTSGRNKKNAFPPAGYSHALVPIVPSYTPVLCEIIMLALGQRRQTLSEWGWAVGNAVSKQSFPPHTPPFGNNASMCIGEYVQG